MRAPVFIAVLTVLLALTLVATHAGSTTAAQLTERVQAFRLGLTPEQQAQAFLSFEDDAREGWNFVPADRKGLKLSDMNDMQRQLVQGICQAALSLRGMEKVRGIQQLEGILYELENQNPGRDPLKYILAVFGTPSGTDPWMLRFEGHHLSLNWTIIGNTVISSTPQFMGSNPGEVREGSCKGLRVLGAEEDLARGLVMALDAQQRAHCILSSTAPPDIITGRDRQASLQADEGIAFGQLTPPQQAMMMKLIEELAHVQNEELAAVRLDKVRAEGLDGVKFAWMGGLQKGQGHYYRIQGKTFLIEYDNTQNNANHVHVVWRDPANDFGRDLLREHYENAPHPAP